MWPLEILELGFGAAVPIVQTENHHEPTTNIENIGDNLDSHQLNEQNAHSEKFADTKLSTGKAAMDKGKHPISRDKSPINIMAKRQKTDKMPVKQHSRESESTSIDQNKDDLGREWKSAVPKRIRSTHQRTASPDKWAKAMESPPKKSTPIRHELEEHVNKSLLNESRHENELRSKQIHREIGQSSKERKNLEISGEG